MQRNGWVTDVSLRARRQGVQLARPAGPRIIDWLQPQHTCSLYAARKFSSLPKFPYRFPTSLGRNVVPLAACLDSHFYSDLFVFLTARGIVTGAEERHIAS